MLKKVEFPKASIKMKNCKAFYEAHTSSCFKEIIQALPPPSPSNHSPSDKILLRLWSKNFLIVTDRNIQIFAFKVFQECSSWASRNGAVQMFFLTPNSVRKVFACVARAYYFQCQVS